MLAGDGTLNEAGGGLAGSRRRAGAAAGRIDERLRRARSASRTRPPTRPASWSTRSPTSRGGASASARRTAADAATTPLPLPPRGGLRRRRHPADGRPRPSLKRHLAHPTFAATTFTTWLRHYDRGTRHPVHRSTASVVAEGPYAVVSNSDPYSYVGHRPLRIAPDASLDDALTSPCCARCARRWSARAATAAGRADRPTSRRHPRSCSAPTSTRSRSPRDAAVPVAGRRRLPRRGAAARRSYARHASRSIVP